MKTAFFKTFALLSVFCAFSAKAIETQPLTCAGTSGSRSPSVTVHTAKDFGSHDELMVVFKTPPSSGNKLDDVQAFKIKDPTGQLTLVFLNYVAQTGVSGEGSKVLQAEVLRALKKYRLYLTQEVAKGNSSPKQILAATALSMTEFLLKDVESGNSVSEKELQAIIRDVVGPMTDYDESMAFTYSQYQNGKYVPQGAKHPEKFLPLEFYKAASSTASAGVVDMAGYGKTHCLPRGVLATSAGVKPNAPGGPAAAGTK